MFIALCSGLSSNSSMVRTYRGEGFRSFLPIIVWEANGAFNVRGWHVALRSAIPGHIREDDYCFFGRRVGGPDHRVRCRTCPFGPS